MIALKTLGDSEQQTDLKATRSSFTLPDHLNRYVQETSEALDMSPSKFLTTILEWASSEGIAEDLFVDTQVSRSDRLTARK